MSKSLTFTSSNTQIDDSSLDFILSAVTKGESERKKKELIVYDNIVFVDANKEIQESEKNGAIGSLATEE